ncbi:DUF2752 domain-containing protein [Algibacter miyuki]|nr:DUF2752 domain-containing protein [Algibacter miyuki]MDN3664132.1 DUF2752 domain-containing protein [Algibacter miyuki]
MQSLEKYMLPCLNKKLFGVECMGCGIQRAFSLLLHGDFVAAFKMYPAIYPLLILVIYIGINAFFKFKQSNKVITVVAIMTVITIITSYLIKIIN